MTTLSLRSFLAAVSFSSLLASGFGCGGDVKVDDGGFAGDGGTAGNGSGGDGAFGVGGASTGGAGGATGTFTGSGTSTSTSTSSGTDTGTDTNTGSVTSTSTGSGTATGTSTFTGTGTATGGGVCGTGQGSGDPVCDACFDQNCCDELIACVSDANCQACLAGGGMNCMMDPLVVGLFLCVQGNCSMQCGF